MLDYLEDVEDLDPAIWLRRLSHDPSPAVRAVAICAASDKEAVDLSDRLDQMAFATTPAQRYRRWRTAIISRVRQAELNHFTVRATRRPTVEEAVAWLMPVTVGCP